MKQETENDIWDDKKGDQSEKEKAVFDLYINFYPGVSGYFLWIVSQWKKFCLAGRWISPILSCFAIFRKILPDRDLGDAAFGFLDSDDGLQHWTGRRYHYHIL